MESNSQDRIKVQALAQALVQTDAVLVYCPESKPAPHAALQALRAETIAALEGFGELGQEAIDRCAAVAAEAAQRRAASAAKSALKGVSPEAARAMLERIAAGL